MITKLFRWQKKDKLVTDIKLPLGKRMLRSWRLYVMLLPALTWLIIFCYVPMYGVLMGFVDYRASDGIMGSAWAGLKYFEMFFDSNIFGTVLSNTLTISVLSLVIGFPIPIIFALLVNQLRSKRLKRVVQTVTYMPNFISIVVIVSMLNIFFSSGGIANSIARLFGATHTISYADSRYFLPILIGSNIWQGMGFAAVIYLAALSSVSPELYEAARVDGASKLRTILHIDLPCIMPTVIMMLILNIGSIMSVGYEKILLMQTGQNVMSSEIINTYVYKMGITSTQYSYSTAISLFNSIINFILLITANFVSKKTSRNSLF